MVSCVDDSRFSNGHHHIHHGALLLPDHCYDFRHDFPLCKYLGFSTCDHESPKIPELSRTCEDKQDHIWLKMREEASHDSKHEPILSEFYHNTILSHDSLETSLSNQLADKLCSSSLSKDALYEVFTETLHEDDEIQEAVRADLRAWKERDPACLSYVHCFLYLKGFQACQAHRISHRLWLKGRAVFSALIQSRVSEVFGVDIHPGARIGRGVVMDHASGVVVGETCVVGDNVTLFHGVTLGGTGKVFGERHPKIGDGVVIGAGAKVLGNIRVGDGAVIGAASVVLKEVPPMATVVGNPARLVHLKKNKMLTE